MNWHCPSCGRSSQKPEELRPVKHHCRGRGRFEETLICNSCNVLEGTVKNRLNIPLWFCFSPDEMSSFIKAVPNSSKNTFNLYEAQKIWERLRAGEVLLAAPKGDPMKVVKRSLRKTKDTAYNEQIDRVRKARRDLRSTEKLVRIRKAQLKKREDRLAQLRIKYEEELHRKECEYGYEMRKLLQMEGKYVPLPPPSRNK